MNLADTTPEAEQRARTKRLLLALKPKSLPFYRHPFFYLIVYAVAKVASFQFLASELMKNWMGDESSNDLMMSSIIIAVVITGGYVWLIRKIA